MPPVLLKGTRSPSRRYRVYSFDLKNSSPFCASGRKKRRSASTRKFPDKRKHGPRLVVRARAAIPDEFSSVPIKTVPQVPVELKLRSAKASRKTLGLEESSDADFTDSEFTIIESESDSETAPENYYYQPGQYIFSPELNRVEDRSVIRSCSAFL